MTASATWLLGALLVGSEASSGSELREADKKVIHRVEREACGNQAEDSWNTQQLERLRAVRDLGEPGRKALMYMAEGRGDITAWNRRCAIRLLGQLGEQRATQVLRGILAEEGADPDLRSDAVYQLRALGDPESLPIMITIVEKHDKRDPAYGAALQGLGEFDDERARIVLRNALTDPKFPKEDRGTVAALLGRQRDKQAIPILAAMTRSSEPAQSLHAIWALTDIGTRDSLAVARDAFTQIGEPRRREAAAREMLISLAAHRRRSQDPDEIRDIDALIELVKLAVAR